MIVRATHFNPEVLLSAPRRSAGVPNASGTHVLFTVSTHDFDSHKTKTELRVLDVSSQESKVLTTAEGVSEPNWIGDDVIFLVPGENGKTLLKIGELSNFEASAYVAGEIKASAGNLRLKKLSNGHYALAFTAPAKPSGDLYNPEEEPEPHTTGRLYDSFFVRHWDTWMTPVRNTIWYGTLEPSEDSSSKWAVSHVTNALRNSGLECPIPPFGGTDHFDISEVGGIIFVAKDPELNEGFNTKCNLYIINLKSFADSDPPAPEIIPMPGIEGAKTSPVFSPDGNKAAFLAMAKNGYEADKNYIYLLLNIKVPRVQSTPRLNEDHWDHSPSSISWSTTGESLYLVAEYEGSGCLWVLPLKGSDAPQLLMRQGSVSSVKPLIDRPGHIFVSGSSLVDNSAYFIVEAGPVPGVRPISSNSRNGAAFGLSPSQVSSFWFPGAERRVQAWVIKPSNFNENEKYPLAYLVHGGPQGAWLNSWNTRWNPAVFAEQGYVVVCPNPTGSTGFGQAFTDAIRRQWGGLPYIDLVRGFEAIKSQMPFVDTNRAVCLGASYGGYMVNWIQGHSLGREFKAMVCHDGPFSIPAGQLGTDEQYFPEHDLGGLWWENPKEWLKWDPAQHVAEWATPQLIIHSAKDYRVNISEGLAAFAALQGRGIESQFLTFPDENHWVLKAENSLLWHTTVLDWINRHVGLPLYGTAGRAKDVLDQARYGVGGRLKGGAGSSK